jgi:hypothetical protein
MNKGESVTPVAAAAAGLGLKSISNEAMTPKGRYLVKCFDKDGNLKWEDEIENLVTTVGKNDALDKYLAGSSYTAAWYLGLIDSGSWSAVNAADTAASHAGWTESSAYDEATRVAPSFAAASSGSKATSAAAAFTMNAGATIKGCFLISNSTKGGTTGILFSAGLFTGGDKVVADNDTLNVSYSLAM